MLALPALAQPTVFSGGFVEPANAEMEKYPILSAPLDLRAQAQLGLTPKVLGHGVVVMNHYRNVKPKNMGRFVLETLPAGTLVLASKDGKLRYKADCGNRIIEVLPCPQCPGTAETSGKNSSKNTFAQPGAWTRFWDNAGKAWDSMWGGLGSLLGFLLPLFLILALIGLIAYAIAQIIEDRIRNRWIGQNPQPTPPPTPPVQPFVPAPLPTSSASRGSGGQGGSGDGFPAPTVAPTPPADLALVPPPAQPPASKQRRFRLEMSDKGNIYGNMNGYRNLVVKENEDGTLIINADRV